MGEEHRMNEVMGVLARWELDLAQVRQRMYRAPTPRERERWHALWLLAQDWSAATVATALDRDPHTIGAWLDAFRQTGPAAVAFEQTGGSPPPSRRLSKTR
jgi:anti-sigma-K factor RskA